MSLHVDNNGKVFGGGGWLMRNPVRERDGSVLIVQGIHF